MDNKLLILGAVLLYLFIVSTVNLYLNMRKKSDFKNSSSFTSKDVSECLSQGLNCSWGRLGCECPSGPASGLKGSIKLARETMQNMN